MSFVIVSMARTGSTSVSRFLCTDPAISIAYEPQFLVRRRDRIHSFLPNLRKYLISMRCRELLAANTGIKHVWDPNGWPFRNRSYISTLENLERSEDLIELNATVARFPERVVFLRRRDQFARTISDLLGQQSGLWGHAPSELYRPEERLHYREMAQRVEIGPISREVVGWYIANAWRQEAALLERVPEQKRMIVYYEDLFDEESFTRQDFSTWVELASWVGAKPRLDDEYTRRVIAPSEKYNTEELLRRIPNYNELRARFLGPDATQPRN